MAKATTYEEIRIDIISRTDLSPQQMMQLLNFIEDFNIKIGARIIEGLASERHNKHIIIASE